MLIELNLITVLLICLHCTEGVNVLMITCLVSGLVVPLFSIRNKDVKFLKVFTKKGGRVDGDGGRARSKRLLLPE